MTGAAVPVRWRQPELAAESEPRTCTTAYGGRLVPADRTPGVLGGMAMTDKQGGSDVCANTRRAVPEGPGGSGREYRADRHKWFRSASMCEVRTPIPHPV
jgi:putative acyl-CoA dehydrogenase